MKRFISAVICFIMIVCMAPAYAAAEKRDYAAMFVDVPAAVVKGEAVLIDSAPYIKNDRTMLPVRFVAESVGADVSWNAEERIVTIVKDDVTLKLKIGDNAVYKNGERIDTECGAEIANDRTMVPVRAVAEGFGLKVKWQDGAIAVYDGKDMNEAQEDEFLKEILSDVERVLKENGVLPSVVNISFGGQLLKGFSPDRTSYTFRTETNDVSKLHVTASADSFSEYEITMPSAIPGDIIINVKSKYFESMENTYIVHLKEPLDFDVRARTYQQGNEPENSVDEDFSTRWAAEGSQWILYTFKEEKEIEKVKIAFWKASADRKAKIKILVGTDLKEMKTVYSGLSTLETEELETFEFEKQKVRYVWLACEGNTVNKWNSILEVRFE